MRLLLISNSTNAGEEYLEYPRLHIREFLGEQKIKALFIPWAGVTVTWDDYEKKVKERFNQIGHDIVSVHHFDDPARALAGAEAIVVGGGNTFRLISMLHQYQLIPVIRELVSGGTPYIGWSAGANVACPTICTTNDMPIVQPASFESFNLVKFQINPHYLDANPDGHAGETREMRITEFLEVNRGIYVTGLREGTMLLIEKGSVKLRGERTMRIFKYGSEPVELGAGDDASFLL